jgi:polyhydroxyalkanoate synthesis regulator phasin
MKQLIKKAFLLGLGAASLTKAQAEKRIKALVKKGAISTKDGREMLRKALVEANKERKRIQEFSKAEVKRIQAKVGKASQPQIKRLKKKINALEKRLGKEGKKTAKKALKKAYRKI